MTLVDLLYEEHTLNPGAVQLCVSAQVDPHHLFMPLLGAAGVCGVCVCMCLDAGPCVHACKWSTHVSVAQVLLSRDL